ncbi:MAG: aminotransferase class IV [Candidatus Eisenbacteria sp.]|nr:aminotransferase class IV [Candidatus Eisenbacteria bacterium]
MRYVWRGRKLLSLDGKEPFERVKGPRYGFMAFTGLLAHWDQSRGAWILPFLDRHIERLMGTADAMKLDHGMTGDDLEKAIVATVRANGVEETSYIHVSAANEEAGIKPLLGAAGRFTVFMEATGGYHPAEGVHLVVLPEDDSIREGVSPVKYPRILGYHHKFNANYLMYGAMKSMAKDIFDGKFAGDVGGGMADGIVLGWRPDSDGFFVTECTTSNLVLVYENEVHFIPPSDFNLNGITQQTTEMLLEKEMGIKTRRVSAPYEEFKDHINSGKLSLFETGTSAGLTNILSVDGRKLKQWDRLDEVKELYMKVALGRHPNYEDIVRIVEPGPVDKALMATSESQIV